VPDHLLPEPDRVPEQQRPRDAGAVADEDECDIQVLGPLLVDQTEKQSAGAAAGCRRDAGEHNQASSPARFSAA
jgi:hypothetical protein